MLRIPLIVIGIATAVTPVFAQVGKIVEANAFTAVELAKIPEPLAKKGATHIVYFYDEEAKSQHIYLSKAQGGSKYKVLQVLGDESSYNPAKGTDYASFQDDTLYICSQWPFRATEYCDRFERDGDKLVWVGEEVNDPNEPIMKAMDSLLAIGDSRGAMEQYMSLQYPSFYVDEREFYGKILDIDHPAALKLYQQKDYKGAVATLDSWANEFASLEVSLMIREPAYGEAGPRLKLMNCYADYGLFLLKAGDLEKAVAVNQSIVKVIPDMTGPYLQLGDAQHALGHVAEAKEAYAQYVKLMEAEGKAASIPSRVKERIQ